MYPKKEIAQLVIAACHHYRVDTVVISPGSRNAPLTIGFSNHPEIEALSVVDERSAAFFALGIAQQTKKPVALVCTSGSALLNYYPAIAEAFYSNIPLVVISADRPNHLVGIGDGQTIQQENVFSNHILFSANLSEKQNNKALVCNALDKAVTLNGPVHINVPFDEPLYETVDELSDFNFADVAMHATESLQTNFQELATIWNDASKIMILIGEHAPNKQLEVVLNALSESNAVIVLTETISNLHGKKFINSIDKVIFTLEEPEFVELSPDLLITVGGMVVSKKIKQVLRTHQPRQHWHIDEKEAKNTYHCLSEFIQEKPVNFLGKLSKNFNLSQSDYQKKWLVLSSQKKSKHQDFLSKSPYADLKIIEQVLETVPDECQLQLSNSTTIRYSQLFDVNKTLEVFSNRGASGIDGCTSTAVGAAFASDKQTVLVTGDVGFFYDSNGLWNNYIPSNFRIIVINNSGGGIFRFIKGPKSTNALDYFETTHQLTAEHLCNMYNFEYLPVDSLSSLEKKLTNFYSDSETPKIMEVFTDKEVNEKVLKDYFKFLK